LCNSSFNFNIINIQFANAESSGLRYEPETESQKKLLQKKIPTFNSMKKLLFILSLISFSIKAQPPGFNFAIGFGGAGIDAGRSVIHDNSGNIYITGSFEGVVDFDPSPSTYTLASSGASDIFVAKYDNSGAFVFAFSIGSNTSIERGSDIRIDNAGNIIVTGMFGGTPDFDPSASSATLSANGVRDLFLAKYSSSGVYQWAFNVGGGSDDEGKRIACDASNNIYLTGWFSATADFDPSPSTNTVSSLSPLPECFLAKYNSSGAFQWVRTIGGSGSDEGTSLGIDNTGAVYLAGNFQNTIYYNTSAPVYSINAAGNTDGFISRYNSNGNYQWAISLGSTADDYCTGLAVDSPGNIYVTGTFSGSVDFDPSANNATLNASTGNDIFIAKFGSNSNFQWARNIGNSVSCNANSISCDINSNLYVTGSFDGVMDFDTSPNTYTLDAGTGADIFVTKYNASGSYLWAFNSTGTGNDAGNALSVDASDLVYVTGIFQDTVDLSLSSGTGTLASTSGSNDVFVARYSQMPCTAPPSPTNVTTAANSTACASSAATLITNGAGTISWYNTSTGGAAIAFGDTLFISTVTAGTYTFYTEANTCAISATRTAVTLTVIASPSVSVAGTNTICPGQSATLTASGANVYSWNVSLTGNSIIVSPTVTTSYTVTGTDSTSGCTNNAITTVSITQCNGLNELTSNDNNIKVFPNPATNEILIENSERILQVEIYNSIGQKIRNEKFDETFTLHLNISEYCPGIYYLKVTGAGNSATFKLLKE